MENRPRRLLDQVRETLQIEIGDSDRDRQNDEMRSCLSLRD